VRIAAVVRGVIGVAVAAPVVVKARHETPAAEMPCVSEVAARRGEVVTRGTASETGPSTAEMAKAADVGPAKAADASAAAEAADVTPAEAAAHMRAAAETMSTTEATTVSTTETTTVPATSAAACKRISGQSPRESGSRCQDDHRFT
jgi:hypothetical protein